MSDTEVAFHTTQYGVIGSLARALAAERAALRELREAVRAALAARERADLLCEKGGDVEASDAVSAAYEAERAVAALVGWPEGARDGDK